MIKAVALGHASSPALFTRDPDAARAAQNNARMEFGVAVQRHLDLVPCPSCSAPGPGLSRAKRSAALIASLLVSPIVLLVIPAGLITHDWTPVLIAWAIAAPLWYFAWTRTWRGSVRFSRERVNFVAKEDSAPE
ncbi:MAG: hypothetical protein QM817_24100 [Archangium sp.]